MGSSQVIATYESLSALTAQMREAAVRGEWDQLIELEQQCRQHVAAMKEADVSAMLDEPSRQRKVRLIKNILAHDADIRSRTVAWMGQLQRIMQSNRQEQRLQQAYGRV
jgi:flagellar protein FliT